MTGFSVLWAGQVLSAVGTRMTNFALGIWVWQQTHRASDLALLTLVAYGATVLCSPLAGSVVDRLQRRWTLIISDLGSAMSTVAALALFLRGTPSLWQLLVVNALTGGFLAFQLPAYAAAITAMTAKDQYTRANGMLSLARSLPAIFAPALGIAGCAPQQALHVGDSPEEDVEAALAAGIPVLLIDRDGDGDGSEGVPRISSLEQIEDHLRA